jgi:hypothetical protein
MEFRRKGQTKEPCTQTIKTYLKNVDYCRIRDRSFQGHGKTKDPECMVLKTCVIDAFANNAVRVLVNIGSMSDFISTMPVNQLKIKQ